MLEYVHHIAYIVADMEQAIGLFRDTLELELANRRMIGGQHSVEMASFRCGPTLIELLRPVDHPALQQFLKDHGPGLHHVAFATKDLPRRIEQLREKGVSVNAPFLAPTGWMIAYFDLDNENLALFRSQYHGDHLAEASPKNPPGHIGG
jgi:methylmalonyl-CoA/ethylmalonyl-CoA epimerase